MNMIFKNLEDQFGITIPIDLKLFLKLIDSNNPIVEYFDPEEHFPLRLTKWMVFNNSKIKIDEIFDLVSLEKYWSRQMEMYGSLNYLPFGSLVVPHAGQLLYKNFNGDLGTICYTETGSREPLYLTSDLFSFLESLKVEYRDDKKNILSSLYRNWNEDFWRVHLDHPI